MTKSSPKASLQQRIESMSVRALLRLPPPVAKAIAGPAQRDGERTLDPRIQVVLRLGRASGRPSLRADSVASSRKLYQAMSQAAEVPVPIHISTRDEVLDFGSHRVRVRAYHPGAFKEILPFVVYFHGGGFVIGDLDTHDSVCRRIAAGAGAVVVSVDYRLAPEHPLPAAIDDGLMTLDALRSDPARFALDPERGAVCGDSAGGNLSAVISQGAGLKGQLLYYPATDASAKTESKRLFAVNLGLEQEDIRWFISLYGSHVDQKDPRLSPRHSETLANSPRTRVVIAGFDPLRDEGREFAQVLSSAGVNVDLVEHSSWIHGYLHMGALPGVAEAIHQDALRLGTWLRT